MENEETLTLEGLRESFGLANTPEPPPAETPPEAPPDPQPAGDTAAKSEAENQTPPPAAETTAAEKPAENKTATPPAEELPLERLNKEAHAFAEMRKKLSDQNKLLSDLGAALGLKGKPEEIAEGLRKITNASQAKAAGIPPEIMERLTALENEKVERAANDRKIQVYAAINNFQRSQNLSQQELNKFLTQLAKAGKNPFEQDIDLRAEYIVMNFDELQKTAIQKALEEQAKRDQHAADHGSTPSTKTGGGDNKTTEVKTMADLEAFLKNNLK